MYRPDQWLTTVLSSDTNTHKCREPLWIDELSTHILEEIAEGLAAVKDGPDSEYGGPTESSQGWCVLTELPQD